MNNAGALAVTAAANGATNAIGGALTLTGGSAFTMADGFTTTLNVAGALTFNGASASSLTFDINGNTASTTDKLAVVGAVTTPGAGVEVIDINDIGTTLAAGDQYTLITAASGLGTAKFVLGTSKITIGGNTYGFTLSNSTGTSEILTVNTSPRVCLNVAYWTGNQGNVWSNTSGAATNWATDITGATDANAQPTAFTDVFFTAIGASNLTNSLGANYTINSLNFTSGAGAVTINAGNTLTINGGNGLTVASGSAAQTINTAIALGNVETWTNNSANTLTLGGAINTNGFFVTFGGSGNIAVTGSISGAGGVTVAGTTTLSGSIGNTLVGSTVTVSSSGTLTETSAGAIASASTLTVNGGTANARRSQ